MSEIFGIFVTSMKRFLNYPLYFPGRKTLVGETLFLTGYALFALFIFQPFGTHEYAHPYKFLQLGGYGLLVMVCYPLIKKTLLHFVKGNAYALKHEALILSVTFLALILLGFFYHAWAIYDGVAWGSLLPFVFTGICFMILPFCAILYHARATAQKSADTIVAGNDKLEIKGTSLYGHFHFKASDVFYLRSNGNYVMIYFLKNGAIKHEMVRNTLNQVSSQLSGADFTVIHRSFLVNVKNFDRLIRDNGKPVLINQQFDIRLPVSRSHLPAIEKRLKDHS